MDNSKLPDFRAGIDVHDVSDGSIVSGRVDSEEAILVRRGNEYFAVGAQCTHYHGALASGLLVDDTVRCPLHHACFSLRTGVALRAPALDPIACWRVELIGEKILVRERIPQAPAPAIPSTAEAKPTPKSVTIIGGGAAGLAAADMLRREGYSSGITILSADDSAPYDRPNLSKDFLTGNAPAEWLPLRSAEYYAERKIELLLGTKAQSIDIQRRKVVLANGRQLDFGALLLATGADPVRLDIPAAAASSWWARALSDLRWRLRCASVESTCMWSGLRAFHFSAYWESSSALSFATFMHRTASCFIWAHQSPALTAHV
jgi:apoptosis-inducing factor 3